MYFDRYKEWEDSGKSYGYPACCRLVFAISEKSPERSKLAGTGYVPCACCERLCSGLLINRINTQRHKSEGIFPRISANFTTILDMWRMHNTEPSINYRNYLSL